MISDRSVERSRPVARGTRARPADPYALLACGVLIHDEAGSVVYANAAAEEMLGESADLLRSRAPLGDLWRATAEDGHAVAESDGPPMEALRLGQSVGRVLEMTRSDGTRRWIRFDSAPISGGVITTLTDETARKAAERQASALARVGRVRETGEMAGALHDLRHHLGAVVGHAEIARRRVPRNQGTGADLDASLVDIIRAAMAGAGTIGRIDADAPHREPPGERVDLGDTFRQIEGLIAPRLATHAETGADPIRLHVEVEEGASVIVGSGAVLRDAIANLVHNAVDAMPRGGTLLLGAHRRGDRVQIEVGDSGTGMSPEVRDRALEPFYTTKGDRGSGLGLANADRAIRQHNGTMEIISAPNLGTTIRVVLPAADRVGAPADSPPLSGARRDGSRQLRILVVENEARLRSLHAAMIGCLGHLASNVATPDEALTRLAAESYDAVIADLCLGPGLDGYGLAEAVRERHPGIRFVLTSNWPLDQARCDTHGIRHVLAKPYRLATLDQLLAAL